MTHLHLLVSVESSAGFCPTCWSSRGIMRPWAWNELPTAAPQSRRWWVLKPTPTFQTQARVLGLWVCRGDSAARLLSRNWCVSPTSESGWFGEIAFKMWGRGNTINFIKHFVKKNIIKHFYQKKSSNFHPNLGQFVIQTFINFFRFQKETEGVQLAARCPAASPRLGTVFTGEAAFER